MNGDQPLPGYVLLVAASMRAVDLLDSGLSLDAQQIVAPDARPGAGLRLELLHAILDSLDRIAADGLAGYVDLETLVREVGKTIERVSEDEVRFVCRFIDADRECLYVDQRDGMEKGTRSRTRLLTYEARRERVKLTDAGRFFLRLGNVSCNWLYEDQQAAKILQAIKLGQFADAEQFALDHARALRELAVSINRQIEAPSFDEMALAYAERRGAINDMLHDAAQSLIRAKAELSLESTREQLERFNVVRGDAPIPMQRLRWLLDSAHAAMESASRTWAGFLRRVQEGGRRHLGVVDFGRAMDSVLAGGSSLESLERAALGVRGWNQMPAFASVIEVMEVLPPIRAEDAAVPLVFDNEEVEHGNAISSWLERNFAALRSVVQKGPQRLSDLIDGGALAQVPITSVEDVSAAFAAFVVSDPFGAGDAVEVRVGPTIAQGISSSFRWSAPDLILSLRGQCENDDDA